MIKLFFTALLFLSCILVAASCKNKVVADPNSVRFEQSLHDAHLGNENTRYLIWNSSSCGGCRSTSSNWIRSNKNIENVVLIVPLIYANAVSGINKDKLFIDSLEVFDKLYFGIDNIGIVNVKDGKVMSIKNYNSNEMDCLKQDLFK